jgi:hypothetical protein
MPIGAGRIAGVAREARVDGERAGIAEQQCVSVRFGFGDRARADIAVAAAAVAHDHLLPQRDR